MQEVFDKEIVVHDYKIAPSKFPKPGREDCLHLQFELDGKMRIVFVSSGVMMKVLELIPKSDFPFKTVIKKVHKRFEFS